MYDPFYTTKEFGHGTGLGLSVVHGVVSSHHGGIAVDSELGVGSRFRIYLPLVDAATSRVAEAGEEPVAVSTRTAHILLVDDEQMVADVLSRGLEQAGFRVTVATDPQQALEAFLRAPRSFDVMVTDQTMSGLTGLDLAEEVHRVRPGLPVLLLTGFSGSLTPERLAESGVDEVLHKPVGRADLVEAIQALVNGGHRESGADGPR